LHQVDAFVGQLGDYVAYVVHNVGVIAATAQQGIDACAAVQDICPAVAGKVVV
jgi:hypothetical protein